ncbi:MAG: 2-oxoacid:ferredoxin oxidoreductase subunit beta [Deinococcota bacterium]|jgi:2-oxoglutarate ferredoxin oxidoreductase subunit beta|nr:2-oxoacid:ferredoxin oxidoreductase subunit beta [Deinococcota bacterium]
MAEKVLTAKDYRTSVPNIWCPGCGDFGVLNAIHQAVAELQIPPQDLAVISGIGCSSRLPGYVSGYGFNTIHGRALPIATGVRLARPDLRVLVAGGDGDAYAIGAGHFVHTLRRNPNLTYIVMDNAVYGLTKGQGSPTAKLGEPTKSQPFGHSERPLNPLAWALSLGVTFLAQSFSANTKGLKELIVKGMEHDGFALLNVKSPCVTFRGNQEYNYYREHGWNFAEDGHDPHDLEAAWRVAKETERVPFGLIWQDLESMSLDKQVELEREKYLTRRRYEHPDEVLETFYA